ncbi:hypothetical protein FF011L_54330 [Roseimaritima multifibrata]|uniref:Phospholipase A2 n=1 Tax=Roseimaritima multifibrata TaxID=1930274 RepID=A0A517MP13_9BACT|nr:hypothetical protein [Roseimaritima multifibrata]QDS96621.1 hypothetical protein FF011L_54330 [Roseimaritima multifibrata]
MNRVLLLFAAVSISISGTVYSADKDRCPCGPDGLTGPLRNLIPQGVGNADWRPYCRAHDACYGIPGVDKASCDRNFYNQMKSSCGCSGKPILCRITAHLMYVSTKRFGTKAFNKSQRLAYATNSFANQNISP